MAVIEHATRRARGLGATAHTGQWVVQLGRNLVMDLQEVGNAAKLLIHDRDAFDAVLADAGLRGHQDRVRTPRTDAIMERWIQTLPA
ncbi:hypothetical protein [Nonomuraea sediminis]|uniref:hypothetical protein n=1 Tax=Nonomuraea sediminis TaxID=2835864 RepID=UPI001BDC6E71|nr:hypothetical protein [Nonomuraea sediminis]